MKPSDHPYSRPTSILWPQVWGLGSLQSAIALTWVIYNLYLPQLLQQFGFPLALATMLLILENLLAVIMEPLMGSLSDRTQQTIASRFPFIAGGTILAAACFVTIPTIALFGSLPHGLNWLLPFVLVSWALAMTVFRSPALSLLGRYALSRDLPQAASILTLMGGLAGGMAPLASQFLLGLGPLVTFTIGSLILLVAAAFLRSVNPNRSIEDLPAKTIQPRSSPSRFISWRNLGLILGIGCCATLGFRLLMDQFPKMLSLYGLENNKGAILGAIFLSLALTAFPAGTLATQLGNRLAMTLGLAGLGVSCLFLPLSTSTPLAIGLAIAIGAILSLVNNGTVPLALSLAPVGREGLGTGLYFSGAALANSLFGMFINPIKTLSPGMGSLLATLMFLTAMVLVTLTRMNFRRPEP